LKSPVPRTSATRPSPRTIAPSFHPLRKTAHLYDRPGFQPAGLPGVFTLIQGEPFPCAPADPQPPVAVVSYAEFPRVSANATEVFFLRTQLAPEKPHQGPEAASRRAKNSVVPPVSRRRSGGGGALARWRLSSLFFGRPRRLVFFGPRMKNVLHC